LRSRKFSPCRLMPYWQRRTAGHGPRISPKGFKNPAQGNALGSQAKPIRHALKGHQNLNPTRNVRRIPLRTFAETTETHLEILSFDDAIPDARHSGKWRAHRID